MRSRDSILEFAGNMQCISECTFSLPGNNRGDRNPNAPHCWTVCIWPRKRQVDQLYFWKVLQDLSHPRRGDVIFILRTHQKGVHSVAAWSFTMTVIITAPFWIYRSSVFGNAHEPSVHLFQYNKVYKNLKEFSQNGEDFCKQITSILQQRYKMHVCMKQFFLFSCSKRYTWRSDYSCPTFQNTTLYFGTWEIALKSDSLLLHIYHWGTIKIRKQQDLILLGKAQPGPFWSLSSPGAHHCTDVYYH